MTSTGTMSRLTVVVALALASAGCVRTSTIALAPGQAHPAVPQSEVFVFLAEKDVPGPYEKLALITAEAATGWTDERQMVDALKKKAGKMGANGIILGDIREPSAGEKIAAAVLNAEAMRQGEAVAIRFAPQRN